MSILKYFHTLRPKKTAAVAKERLQIIVAHERNLRDSPVIEYLPELQQELLAVVRKYTAIQDEDIKINIEKDGECEILELNITLSDENQ
ncbi:cell division topological specificity factor MinE [Candidatus Halobeggiatoa sp. HSG11]|nr:cell division topological specificity factor MinE [Candidatus Halobeggiatoa sp. HSG11]